MNLWTAIEALFGPENRFNIGERLRKRVAKFLNDDGAEAVTARDMVDDGYDLRSAALHGSRLENPTAEEVENLMLVNEGIVLTTLRKVLGDPTLIRSFCSPSRDAYLDALTKGFPDRPRRKASSAGRRP